MRVHELAKQLNIPPKEMITVLNDLGFSEIKSNFNAVSDDMVKAATAKHGKGAPAAAPAAKAPAAPAAKAPTPAPAQAAPKAPAPAPQAPAAAPAAKAPTPAAPQAPAAAPAAKAPAPAPQAPAAAPAAKAPAAPQAPQARPAQPMAQPQRPAQPMGQPQRPAQPMGQPQRPGQPMGQPQRPGQPMGQPQRPAQPMGQPQRPGQPMGQPQRPAQPMGQPQRPAAQAAPGPRTAGRPGAPASKKPGSERRGERDEAQREGKGGRRGRDRDRGGEAALATMPKVVKLSGSLTVKELADKMHIRETEIIKRLFMKGIMATINQTLELDVADTVAREMEYEVELVDPNAVEIAPVEAEEVEENQITRPAVVTIMGHVDHGKTSLLDAIRKANVAAGESGGITQHIGAYQVKVGEQLITFLDTPGHEAFTAMRARGAKATDVAILVVAADDGVKPQTIEAINHAKEAGVQIIVAINKIDKVGANPDTVKQQLTEYGLVAEEWGGQTVMVPVSAKQKVGLENLLEMILLVAEILELKANPKREAKGLIIEAQLDKGMGPVATVLVQNGTLRVGDNFVVGSIAGKVRAMINDQGKRVREAGPSMPVEILGMPTVPQAGDIFQVVADEKTARQIAGQRAEFDRTQRLTATRHISLNDVYSKIQEGKIKDLKIILKADVKGSAEALEASLSKISAKDGDVRVRVIHSGTGDVSEADVMLAEASDAVIVAFRTKIDDRARAKASHDGVDIREYDVIYKAIEDAEAALHGMLEPEYEEVFGGRAEVRAIFKVGKTGIIAGCMVKEGKVQRNSTARVFRDGEKLYEGKLTNLKRFKDDAKEVASGYECGISFDEFNDLQEGDVIETYTRQPKK